MKTIHAVLLFMFCLSVPLLGSESTQMTDTPIPPNGTYVNQTVSSMKLIVKDGNFSIYIGDSLLGKGRFDKNGKVYAGEAEGTYSVVKGRKKVTIDITYKKDTLSFDKTK